MPIGALIAPTLVIINCRRLETYASDRTREGGATHVLIVCREALRSAFERLIGQLERSADPPRRGVGMGEESSQQFPTSLSTETRLFELAWSDRQRSIANQSRRLCREERKDIIIEKRGQVIFFRSSFAEELSADGWCVLMPVILLETMYLCQVFIFACLE